MRVVKAGRWCAAVLVVSALGVAGAQARRDAGTAVKPKLAGVVFGGVTRQGWPVIVEVSHRLPVVTRAAIGIDTPCTSGDSFSDSDSYHTLRLSRAGTFKSSFGPDPNGSPSPGITETAQGSITGKINRSRTKASGTWRLVYVERNAAGVVTDTCDSGLLHWSAVQ